MTKKRAIKKFEQLEPAIRNLIKETFPDGYEDELISLKSSKGDIELALPLETEEISYLIKMPKNNISEADDDEISPSEDTEINFDSLKSTED